MRIWMGDCTTGGLVDEADAHVSVLDHGLLLGDSLFETILTEQNDARLVDRHIQRLLHSAEAIGLNAPDAELLQSAIKEVIDPAAAGNGRLRITLTAGDGPLGLARGTSPRLLLLWEPLELSTAPLRLALSAVTRSTSSSTINLKTGSWLENVMAMREARSQGADDALILNDRGEVAETATANVFVIKNDTILTPPLASGCLAGVTRKFLIEHIPAELRFAEIPFSLEDLFAADEVFVTSALRGVSAVGAVGEQNFIAPGPITARLQSVFAQSVKESHV